MWSFKVLRSQVCSVERVLLLDNRSIASSVKGINFNSKHLKKGDPDPAYNGILRVYNMRFCPYAQRTMLALNAKEIDYELVNVNLINKPDWIFNKSPFGKVPVLEIKQGETIYESLATVEYLDEVYPQRPLLPKDPVQRARDKMVVELSGAIHTLFFKLVKTPDKVNEHNVAAYRKVLDVIQEELVTRGSKFLYGNEPGYVDYMIWPWFERLQILAETNPTANIDAEKYKLLLEYIANMRMDPVISQYLIPDDILIKFHSGFQLASGPNYDLLLNKD
ncbi:pyrimidodiazepine synthase-like [Ostrinia nubilalis]|uniref:pyrimidodiazepine synthase-like n=1 Tax=Ostrinia nubilalis TaxID=29057 RepID=UPI0030824B11